MTFLVTDGLLGAQAMGDIFVPDTTQRFALGQCVEAIDTDFFGWGQFIYGKASAAIALPGRLQFMDYQWNAADIPNTANTGYPVYVAKAQMAINTFGWFQVAGFAPIQTANSVAIGTATGVAAAGQLGTLAAGKQLLNARVVQPSTFAPTKTIQTQNGSPIIKVSNNFGLFVGLTISGTGVSGTVIAVNPNGNEVTLSANASATGTVTGTFTWTGFLGVQFNSAHVQGAIT
jgi:hypothetical protein